MAFPLLALIVGVAGLAACAVAGLIALWPASAASVPIPRTELNRDIDITRYKATDDSILFLAKTLPDHPFKIGDGGVFCSVCLINQQLKLPTGLITVHDHACTVIRKDWKILICRDVGRVEYFISLDRPYLKRGS